MNWRELARSAVVRFVPSGIAHRINVVKNVHWNFLEPEMAVLVRLLEHHPSRNKGLFAVDIGANLGLYCYLFARGGARVLAVEPQPRLAEYLRQAFRSKIDVRQAAVSDRTGSATLRIPRIPNLRTALQMDAFATIEDRNNLEGSGTLEIDQIEVPTTTLDALTSNLGSVDFVKIDVEGHEAAVIAGATETIRKFHPIFLIEIEKRHNSEVTPVPSTLFDNGYIAFYYTGGRIVPAADLSSLLAVIHDNVRNGEEVKNFFFLPETNNELINLLNESSAKSTPASNETRRS